MAAVATSGVLTGATFISVSRLAKLAASRDLDTSGSVRKTPIFRFVSPIIGACQFRLQGDLEIIRFPNSSQFAMAVNATDPLWTLEPLPNERD
jgi:hypothetical protein